MGSLVNSIVEVFLFIPEIVTYYALQVNSIVCGILLLELL